MNEFNVMIRNTYNEFLIEGIRYSIFDKFVEKHLFLINFDKII